MVGRGSVFRLSVVGRWGLSAGGGVEGAGGGLEVENGLAGRGGGRTRGDRGGRSGVSAAGGGGGGRGGVRGGGESRVSGLRVFSVVTLPVSGRLWVRPVLPVSTVADSARAASGSQVASSVSAGGSEVVALEITDEPPVDGRKKYKLRLQYLKLII